MHDVIKALTLAQQCLRGVAANPLQRSDDLIIAYLSVDTDLSQTPHYL